VSRKKSVPVLPKTGTSCNGMHPIFVHLLSGKTEAVAGTDSIFAEQGRLVCCGDSGLILETFELAGITFATYDPSLHSLNVWI